MPKILGIDLGTRYIGVAKSDDSGKIALPSDVIEVRNSTEIVPQIVKIAKSLGVEKIVIGLPLHLSGDESRMSSLVREIAEKLRALDFDIILWDERFSSIQAEKAMREMEIKPSRNKKRINEISAVLILQTYLDSQNRENYEQEN